jgi:hypothetical protein
MTQSSTWCERLQARLMAALDAAWATIEGSNDPDLIRKACDKARICGDMAAQARKVAAMVPAPKPARMSQALAGQLAGQFAAPVADAAVESPPARKLARLKGGRRGRL